MKRYIFFMAVLLLVQAIGFAQRPSERRTQVRNAGVTDAFLDVKEVPVEFQKESAVVLAQKTSYTFTTKGGNMLITELNRRKIKLQDKAATVAFTEYYYSSADGNGFQITILKPDGNQIFVNSNDAIKVTTAIPEYYRSAYSGKNWSYYKVVLPNLEPGDILDYYNEVTETRINAGIAQCFSPVVYTPNDSYTILKQKLDFKVEKGFYVNIKTGNGAPELVQSKEDPSDRRHTNYAYIDGVRPRVNSSLWVYRLRELPYVKFQVCFNQIGKESNTFQLLGKPNEPKQKVTPEEIVERVNYRYANAYNPAMVSIVNQTKLFMKENHRQVTDPEKYARLAYYHLRNALLVDPKLADLQDATSIRDDFFAIMLMKVLDEKDIKYNLFVGSPRSLGPIENTVFYDELSWFLKIGEHYIFNPGPAALYGEADATLQGTKAYQITLAKNKKEQGYKVVTIPSSSFNSNAMLVAMQLNLDKGMEKVEVKSTTNATGLYKYNLYGNALAYVDLAENDHLSFGGARKEASDQTRNKVKLAEIERKKKAEKEENAKKKIELLKTSIEEEQNKKVLAYSDFTLVKDGRSDQNQELVYDEKYVLGDLVKKVGPNFILEIGSLIGGQVEIIDQEKERKFDINLPYAKAIRHQITLTIPEGFTVEGLNDLNTTVTNAAGSFTSKSKIEKNQLVINTEKIYKNEYQKKESWSQMLEFLDAAYTFTQKKVVLKKQI